MTYSGFTDVDATGDPRTYVDRLDRTGAMPLWRSIKQRVAELLEIQSGDRVLDVGCGTGDDTRELARRVGADGLVVGVDRSAAMIDEARGRARGSGVAVAYCRADARHLAFADGSFTGCRAERVLQHLEAPREALLEMARVVAPGARVVVVEPDYGTLAFRGADSELTRQFVAHRQHHFRSSTIGRHLGAWLLGAGLRDLTLSLITNQQSDLSPDDLDSLRRTYVDPAVAAGAIRPEEGQRWLDELEASAVVGSYRYAVTIFLARARKPGSSPATAT